MTYRRSFGTGGGGYTPPVDVQVGNIDYNVQTSDGDIFVNYTGGGFLQIFLPPEPTIGEEHTIKDYAQAAGANPFNVRGFYPSGEVNVGYEIEQRDGSSYGDLTFDQNGQAVRIRFTGNHWEMLSYWDSTLVNLGGGGGSAGTYSEFNAGSAGSTVDTDTFAYVNAVDMGQFDLTLTTPPTSPHRLTVLSGAGFNSPVRLIPASGQIYRNGSNQIYQDMSNTNGAATDVIWNGTDWFVVNEHQGTGG